MALPVRVKGPDGAVDVDALQRALDRLHVQANPSGRDYAIVPVTLDSSHTAFRIPHGLGRRFRDAFMGDPVRSSGTDSDGNTCLLGWRITNRDGDNSDVEVAIQLDDVGDGRVHNFLIF